MGSNLLFRYTGQVFKYLRNRRSIISVLIIITIIVTLHILLPLNRPVFFLKYTETERTYNASKYIHTYPGSSRKSKPKYKVLLWTTRFHDELWDDFSGVKFTDCPFSNCDVTYNKSDVYTADALLFHGQDLYDLFWFAKGPTQAFYHPLPKYRNEDQLWILVNLEPPTHLLMDYSRFNGLFNLTASYRQSSEIYTPYGKVIKRSNTDTDGNTDDGDVIRTGVVWVAGNCFDHAHRQVLIHQLEKYIRIDKFGACGKGFLSSKDLEQSRYRFYLSFENSVCDEYVTEKFFRPLQQGMIPVVLGGVDSKKLAPPHSYIDIREFNGVKELADYLNYLEKNNTAYKEYFKWKKEYRIEMDSGKWTRCLICEKLNSQKFHQAYVDLDGWFNSDICHSLSLAQHAANYVDGFASYIGLV